MTPSVSNGSTVPDRVGVWRLTDHNGETTDFDVYKLPTGHLCAWCEDVDVTIDGDSIIWDSDEWVGHVPVECMVDYGTFKFVSGPLVGCQAAMDGDCHSDRCPQKVARKQHCPLPHYTDDPEY